MRKEYVIIEISASPDGSPYVLITLKDPAEVRGPLKPASPVMTFTSMDDMFRNLGHAVSRQIMGGFATVIKLSLNEYEGLDIKVGDRVSIDISKTQIGVP